MQVYGFHLALTMSEIEKNGGPKVREDLSAAAQANHLADLQRMLDRIQASKSATDHIVTAGNGEPKTRRGMRDVSTRRGVPSLADL
jgi:hypothetical protein